MSEVKTNKISPATGTAITLGDSGDTFTVPSGASIVNSGTATGFGGGVALQVSSNLVTTAGSQSITIATVTDVTNMTCSITPSSTDSKILVQALWSGEESVNSENALFGLKRGSTEIGAAAQVGSRAYGMTMNSSGSGDEYGSSPGFAYIQYIDSPSTISSTTYKMTFLNEYAGATLYNNRTVVDGDAAGYERLTSSIILTELSAASTLTNGA
jgi:hypothetical protein